MYPGGKANIGRFLRQVRKNEEYLQREGKKIKDAEKQLASAQLRNERDIGKTKSGLDQLNRNLAQERDQSGIDRQIQSENAKINKSEQKLDKQVAEERAKFDKVISDTHTSLQLKRWSFDWALTRFNEHIEEDIYDAKRELQNGAIFALQRAWKAWMKAVGWDLHPGRTGRGGSNIYLRPDRFSAEPPDVKDIKEAEKRIGKLNEQLKKFDADILKKKLEISRARSEISMKGIQARSDAYQKVTERQKQIRQWEQQLGDLEGRKSYLEQRKGAIENAKKQLAGQKAQVARQRAAAYRALSKKP